MPLFVFFRNVVSLVFTFTRLHHHGRRDSITLVNFLQNFTCVFRDT